MHWDVSTPLGRLRNNSFTLQHHSKIDSCREEERRQGLANVELGSLHGHILAGYKFCDRRFFHGDDVWVTYTRFVDEADECEMSIAEGVSVDSMRAMLNPEIVYVERGRCIERGRLSCSGISTEAVQFGKEKVEEGRFVGNIDVVMPGARVANGGSMGVLSITMKEEIVKSRIAVEESSIHLFSLVLANVIVLIVSIRNKL